MDESAYEPEQEEQFSWDRWLMQGINAFRRTLFRYNLGLPDEFWDHLERAAHEMLAAGRILLRTILSRRRQSPNDSPEPRGQIDIDWE